MKTTRKARRPAPVVAAPSSWKQLQAILAANRMDTTMAEEYSEITEALALLKYAGPEIRHVETLIVALRLLVGATIRIAEEHQYFESMLTDICTPLHDHIRGFGLMPNEGRGWKIMECLGGPLSTSDAQFRAMLFPAS